MGGDWMDEKENEPYRELFITITFQSSFITFQPPQILFIPVPLENKATATLTLHASGYPRLVCVYSFTIPLLLYITRFKMWRKLEPSAVFYQSILSMWAEELPYQLKWMRLNKRMGWKSSLFLWFSQMETSSLPNHWMRYSLGNLSIKP